MQALHRVSETQAQEQTLIPLTVLFMPGQPELTFLTCLCRFHFTLPPGPDHWLTLELAEEALGSLRSVAPHRWG